MGKPSLHEIITLERGYTESKTINILRDENDFVNYIKYYSRLIKEGKIKKIRLIPNDEVPEAKTGFGKDCTIGDYVVYIQEAQKQDM